RGQPPPSPYPPGAPVRFVPTPWRNRPVRRRSLLRHRRPEWHYLLVQRHRHDRQAELLAPFQRTLLRLLDDSVVPEFTILIETAIKLLDKDLPPIRNSNRLPVGSP